jgi:hypothetical protein
MKGSGLGSEVRVRTRLASEIGGHEGVRVHLLEAVGVPHP